MTPDPNRIKELRAALAAWVAARVISRSGHGWFARDERRALAARALLGIYSLGVRNVLLTTVGDAGQAPVLQAFGAQAAATATAGSSPNSDAT